MDEKRIAERVAKQFAAKGRNLEDYINNGGKQLFADHGRDIKKAVSLIGGQHWSFTRDLVRDDIVEVNAKARYNYDYAVEVLVSIEWWDGSLGVTLNFSGGGFEDSEFEKFWPRESVSNLTEWIKEKGQNFFDDMEA